MRRIQIIKGLVFQSNSDGTESSIKLDDAVFSALDAEHGSLYVDVHDVDSDTQLKVSWQHGPSGENLWTDGSGELFDSGGTASTGLHASGSLTTLTAADAVRPVIRVQMGTPTTRVSIRISVWVVLTPF